ncbi:MAG: family 78 glycoside hydrolase catalytic domain, partial [Clostridia bacterium]|nr:family 78 glycoside hydrolase catalytic domain [Clostridia bacterium]
MRSDALKAAFITLPAYSGFRPVNVFHRQLEPLEIRSAVPKDLHILYRTRLNLKKAGRTVIRITADDCYKLWVNGRFAGQGPAPCFPWKTYVNEIDLSPYLKDGDNVLAFHTLYQGLINRVWVSGDDRLGLWFEVVCDGKIVAVSDSTVKCRLHSGFFPTGIVGYDTQFMERYDSRSPESGFESPDYDDSSWGYAEVCREDDHVLTCQPSSMLVFEEIPPAYARTLRSQDGKQIVLLDFGAQYVGTLQAAAKGLPGDTVFLRFGQELTGEGRVRFEMRSYCRYEEEWILSGGQDRLDEFDYKSFRYAEIELPDGAQIQNVRLLARHYPFRPARSFSSQDPDLETVWNLSVRSLRYGVQEVIQDCMDREKGQYLGDGSFTATTFSVLTGDLSILEKMIDNAFDTSVVNPGLMTCSPCSMMQEIADYVLMLPHLLRVTVLLSGSPEFASSYYAKMAETLDYFRARYEREDGLLYDLDKWCLVDWPAPARDGYDFDLKEGRIHPGTHCVINAYYAAAVKAMNRLAEETGRGFYRDPDPLIRAFVDNFHDPQRHAFRDIPKKADILGNAHCALPSSVFALCFGLCPDRETEEETVRRILEAPA